MMNIFMPPKITQKHSKPCLFTGNIRKTAFSILFTTKKEVHQSKKVNVKTLPRGHTQKGHTKGYTRKCVIWVCQPDKHALSNWVFKATRII